jgi:hypothetical protein
MVKFNIGSFIKVNTDNKWLPIELSDTAVDVFFGACSIAHGYQAYRAAQSGDLFQLGLHGVGSFLGVLWPYMIHNEYTHKGLSHMSYGLAAMIPNLAPLQSFGALMAADKVYNLDGIHFNKEGTKTLFNRGHALNPYGTDNAFVDSVKYPAKPQYLPVTPAYFAGASLFQLIKPDIWNRYNLSVINWSMASFMGFSLWHLENV